MLFSCATPWENFIFTGNSLTQHKFITSLSYNTIRSEINQAKIKVLSGFHSFWKFEERICFLEFSSFKRLFAFLDSALLSVFEYSNGRSSPFHMVLFQPSVLVFHFRNPVITLGPPQIIQDNVPILWSAD